MQPQNFQSTGLIRLAQIIAPAGPIPVSRSTWWAGVKAGRFPQPLKLGPRTTCWRAEDIRRLAEEGWTGPDDQRQSALTKAVRYA
ncbi:AlpA family phage regulatory protein [Lichenihabitans sp. PAMC28606]|uniref:helix-turn-helix transcriptional regulator n=1 Tax=Lichenihabitans sp. PAMC28606 TaxID=2880932 RepID=UPI001D09CB9D|nr:AlpA family phage regulatory protein [Lichenihabitans sp. PAMC28606]UDL96282.1 AlpA family phage regulatory protein [Lichenihabitans sp. PAMC28606]